MSSPRPDSSSGGKQDQKSPKGRKATKAHKVHLRLDHRHPGQRLHDHARSWDRDHHSQNEQEKQRSRQKQHQADQDDDDGDESQIDEEDEEEQSQVVRQTDHDGPIPIDFVTLGMFIIDDIDFAPPNPPVRDILGGAGSYSALGARLFSPGPLSSTVGWIVDQGSDFPQAVTTLIHSWETTAVMRLDQNRLTTRGWNGYEGTTEKRAFRYMTAKKRLTAEDLDSDLLQSRSFHLICSPTRCQQIVAEIISRRKAAVSPDSYSRPIFVWEPVPDMCTPDELLNCTNTLPLVDVCSPNHAELAGFMGDDGLDPDTGRISTTAVERYCEQLLASMPLQSYTLVVRAGDQGCYIAKNAGTRRRTQQGSSSSKRRKRAYGGSGLQLDTDMEALFAGLLQEDDGTIARDEVDADPGLDRWMPPFHRDASKVIDPTGGGNTFLGGLGTALARGETVEEAAIWGSVAASFAIEQVGMPILARHSDGSETWNEYKVQGRLREYRHRL